VGLAALREDRTLSELSSEYWVQPSLFAEGRSSLSVDKGQKELIEQLIPLGLGRLKKSCNPISASSKCCIRG
jgi:hypothetical protein